MKSNGMRKKKKWIYKESVGAQKKHTDLRPVKNPNSTVSTKSQKAH